MPFYGTIVNTDLYWYGAWIFWMFGVCVCVCVSCKDRVNESCFSNYFVTNTCERNFAWNK